MNRIKKTLFNTTKPKYAHITEHNALKAGESAFKARIPFYSNPYNDNPFKSAWIRGFKRAERLFTEGLKRSKAVQDSVGFEEIEG